MKRWMYGVMATVLLLAVGARGQVSRPDLNVCNGRGCGDLSYSVCTPAGYVFALTNFQPAAPSNSGTAVYTYEICNPAAGTCVGTKAGTSCGAHSTCWPNSCPARGVNAGKCSQDQTISCTTDVDCNDTNANYCSGKTVHGSPTACVPDAVQAAGLSHFDISFPPLAESCLGSGAEVTGSCSASGGATVGAFGLGDGSCFGPTSPVAKCDSTSLPAGGCITMTLNIAGELTAPGVGLAIVVDKEGQDCQASCLAGPSCDSCIEPPPDGEACLTRTIGFWGTHPGIAAQYDPVEVCGYQLDGQVAGECSTSEALCTSANDRKQNTPYLQLVAQLTAAQLNLNATAGLEQAGLCSGWEYQDKTIQTWIETCELLCGESKKAISDSGCIEALTAFNESQDVGLDTTPGPFDRPGPADPTRCQAARGNGKFIGDALCSDS